MQGAGSPSTGDCGGRQLLLSAEQHSSIVAGCRCLAGRMALRCKVCQSLPMMMAAHLPPYRYTATIINGSQNPHRLEVGKDISRAIIKVPAHNGIPSTYWTREEQERLLINAYDKWAVYGGVWSAASAEVSLINIDAVKYRT